MRRILWILLILVAILVTVWLSGGFKTAEKAPIVEAPVVPTQPAPAPTEEPEKAPAPVVAEVEEEEPLVELGLYMEITKNYNDQAKNPSVQVGPGEAVVGTADPGSVGVNGIVKGSDTLGFVFGIYNRSTDPIEVVFETSWNGNPTTGNQHWNISPVLFKVNDFEALLTRVNELQKADAKPKVLFFEWDGTSLNPVN